MAASYVAPLPWTYFDDMALGSVLHDATRYSVGAGQRDGAASNIPPLRGERFTVHVAPQQCWVMI